MKIDSNFNAFEIPGSQVEAPHFQLSSTNTLGYIIEEVKLGTPDSIKIAQSILSSQSLEIPELESLLQLVPAAQRGDRSIAEIQNMKERALAKIQKFIDN